MKRVILVMLLVAVAGCQVTMSKPDPQAIAKADKQKAVADMVGRIEDYELVKQEQQLIYEIMKLRYDTAAIQNAMQPKQIPPVEKE